MAKYIIDVPDDTTCINALKYEDSKCVAARSYIIPDLTPYTEPNRETIENEVWEFAQKFTHESKAELNAHERMEIWGTASCDKIINDFTYSEAKARYEEWEAEREQIRVGDEVDIDGEITVVTMVNKYGEILSVDCDGMTYYYHVESQLKRAKKTGRHFDEVEDLLKKIKEK